MMAPANLPARLRIGCLLDNRPGHAFQVEAVVKAIGKKVPIEVDRFFVGRPDQMPLESGIDLCIGAGRKTNWKLAKIGIKYRVPTVVIMRPSLPTLLYSLCIIPIHDNPPSRPNILPIQFAPTTVTPGNKPKSGVQVALIGGPSSHYDWEYETILHRLRELDRGTGFEILTSRRTPLESAKALEVCGRVIVPSQISRNQYESLLESAARIVITPDSVSMLSDALATDACIFSVPLRKKTSKVADYFDEACVQTQMNTGIKNDPITEADRIADHILQRFFV